MKIKGLVNKLTDLLRFTPEDSDILRTVICMENIRRVLILSLVAIPTSALYLIIFSLKAGGSGGAENQWRTAILTSHTVLLLSFTVIGILIYFFSYRQKENNLIARICVHMAVVLLLFGGALITAADQLVITSVTAFLSTSLVVGLIFLLPPVRAFIYFISSYIVFYFAISWTQPNPDVLVSNQINGLTATALGLCLSFILWRGYLVRIRQTRLIEKQYNELKSAQDKLVTQSKLAALGALTAGIAHEIKNPLNFINNFAALNAELADELKDLLAEQNEKMECSGMNDIEEIMTMIANNAVKIQEHSKRADGIVRSMLQHSRGGSGEKHPTDINALLEEALNLTYHGLRAQDAGFNVKIEKSFDETVGKLHVVPQELSRAFLNIINNGCYEAYRKKLNAGSGFSPVISVRTEKVDRMVKITIRDNGDGIPESVKSKLFTPFFTTKPAGQGTGLGLSITYDIIVHQHHGQISFETVNGSYTEFSILLPCDKS